MIQVCSQCGTRWNVRDRQRVWCPRCNGTLLAPGSAPPAPSPWSAQSTTAPAGSGASRTPPRLPPGYRWIAVRPGAAPPPRGGRRPLGPTPRYSTVPRWGLVEHFDSAPQDTGPAAGPSPATVRAAIIPTMVILAGAAFAHLVRYVLLLINRGTLLHPWVAAVATWLPVVLSVVAVFAVAISMVVLTNWLIARRAGAYGRLGLPDPRPTWALWAGCLLPVVNLLFAPVFIVELARIEDRLSWLRTPIVAFWVAWLVSYVLSVFATVTSFAQDPQGIADNTVITTVAYLLALATLVLLARIHASFDRTPVERPARRWVVVPDGADEPRRDDRPGEVVESGGQNPAA
ncbi:DUF4328 domain-containing protein [Mycolicibacterium thermoresistibile]